jgi:hypothetical protein
LRNPEVFRQSLILKYAISNIIFFLLAVIYWVFPYSKHKADLWEGELGTPGQGRFERGRKSALGRGPSAHSWVVAQVAAEWADV